jgi:hypothetical protein
MQAKWEHDDLLLETSADLTEQSPADLGTSPANTHDTHDTHDTRHTRHGKETAWLFCTSWFDQPTNVVCCLLAFPADAYEEDMRHAFSLYQTACHLFFRVRTTSTPHDTHGTHAHTHVHGVCAGLPMCK